jgi:hypothetical protein
MAAFMLASAIANGAEPPTKARTPDWRFYRTVDKMTDKVQCVISTPNGPITWDLRNGRVAIFSKEPMAVRSDAVFVFKARIDKNEPLSFPYFRLSVSNLALADFLALKEMFTQMQSGSTLLVRFGTAMVSFEREYELRSFPAAYNKYLACMTEAFGDKFDR